MKQFTSRLESDWLTTMEMISHSLGGQMETTLSTPLVVSVSQKENNPQPDQASSLPAAAPGGMSRKMMQFAQVISALNEKRLHRQPFDLINQITNTTLSVAERDAVR